MACRSRGGGGRAAEVVGFVRRVQGRVARTQRTKYAFRSDAAVVHPIPPPARIQARSASTGYSETMKLFDVLALHHLELRPDACKLHLATSTAYNDPLDEFLAGRFEAWQSWQGKRNFELPFIVAMVPYPGDGRWLLTGCFRRLGCDWVEAPPPAHWAYRTSELPETTPLAGRVVVGFRRPGRAAYLDAAKWASALDVRGIFEHRVNVSPFPGYGRVHLPKPALDLIVSRCVESWRAALSAVAGVYLIVDDSTGRLYVGSASGAGGIWARWCEYAADGHGGNVDLRSVLAEHGPEYARNFHFSVLEIADTHASAEDVVRREGHWKAVLRTREHGYNRN